METQTDFQVKCIYFNVFQSKTTSHVQLGLVKTELSVCTPRVYHTQDIAERKSNEPSPE